MYTKEILEKYDYFEGFDLEYVLDPLTGVISRGYILSYVKSLIEREIPFAFVMMDIDNFKLVNDNYGHSAGDECLRQMGESLIEVMGDRGLVGRFGGDEFICVVTGVDPTYDNIYEFLRNFYGEHKVARRTYCLGNLHIFITSTAGSASYPYDAQDYDSLFECSDKALYRGKTKGRNCFIVYLESKHKDIDVHKLENHFLPEMFCGLESIFKQGLSEEATMKRICDYISEEISVPEVRMMFKDCSAYSNTREEPYKIKKSLFEDLSLFTEEKHYSAISGLNESGNRNYKKESPALNRFITEVNGQSVITVKIGISELIGYLVIFENKIVRMWQEREIAFAIYVARMISVFYLMNNK